MIRQLVAVALVVAGASVADAGLPPGVTAADPPAAPGAGSAALASTPAGARASWIESGNGASRVRTASFDGARWSRPATVAETEKLFANWADTPGTITTGGGAAFAWWLERTGADTYAYSIAVARSADDGATWSRLGWLADDRVPAEHGFVSMVPEGSGVRAFWLDGRDTLAGRPMALRSAAIGVGGAAAIGASAVIDVAVCDCCPTAAVLAAGIPVLAYRDRTPDEVRDVRVVRWLGGPALAAPLAGDGWRIAGCPVNGPALAGAEERLAVVWFTAPGDAARVVAAVSNDGGRAFGPPVVVDAERPLGRVGAAALPGGDFALSWLARVAGGAEVRLQRLSASGRLGRPLALAATGAGRDAGIPRLAALADGRLLAAWIETAGGPPRLRAAVVEPSALPAP